VTKRELLTAKTAFADAIRRYVAAQADKWRRVPALALAPTVYGVEGDFRLNVAFHCGLWNIVNRHGFNSMLYVDCSNGHLCILDCIGIAPAGDTLVISFADQLEVFDADAVITDLEAATTIRLQRYTESGMARVKAELVDERARRSLTEDLYTPPDPRPLPVR
jgi:hypothetical protein